MSAQAPRGGPKPPRQDVPTFRVSTADFPKRERLTAWREICGRTVCNLDIDPMTGDRFRAEATGWRLPGLGMLVGATSGVRFTHSRELIADDDLSFLTGPMPKRTASQLGRNPMLGPGDGVLMNNAEVATMTLPQETRFLTFRVPVAAIAPLVPDVAAVVAKRVPSDSKALQLLARYLEILQDTSVLATPQLQDLATAHVHDLLALALGATHEAGEIANGRGLRAARLQTILAEIKAHFAEPGFSPGDVARRLGVSPRYVQDVLHDTGVSFTERVMELKLQKARAMLAGVGAPKIIDVAYGCGFGDISYFNRCFRRRFGAAPSDFRAGGRADG
ncbi:MAG TPA: helix-turn-helix domain-containing protein [Xanthobacteraceae bacterium]|jgi:AraC-like DNA-binding protein|nr:helix-turn-helix domain-containing protein [Xanthobacteraceae bacterium]